jgi:hypothetical protein
VRRRQGRTRAPASPSSAAHIASAIFHTAWRECDGPISGQRPARSEVASAVRAATSIIRGVKFSWSIDWTSILAASASPMRSNRSARAATQSTGWMARGASTRDSKARRSRIEVQREGKGALSRRISVAR